MIDHPLTETTIIRERYPSYSLIIESRLPSFLKALPRSFLEKAGANILFKIRNEVTKRANIGETQRSWYEKHCVGLLREIQRMRQDLGIFSVTA